MKLPEIVIDPIVRLALAEDFGNSGDPSAQLLVPETATATLHVNSRDAGTVSGWQAARRVYALVDGACELDVICDDGARVYAGDRLGTITGPVRSLLMAERTALNFLGRMSGIATLTAHFVDAVAGTGARIAATRKTTPGLRALEKQAVLAGGGAAHRESLSAAIMIKDNHIALASGIEAALKTVIAGRDHMMRVSVEVDTLDQLRRALPFGPDVILLDNMEPDRLREAVAIAREAERTPVLEASGGVDLDTVRAIAESGVDVISIGALTHSALNFDIGMDSEM